MGFQSVLNSKATRTLLNQQKLLRLSEQGELARPEPHDVLGCGGAGVGGEVTGLGVDSEHGPYHNQSLYHPSS